MADSGSYTAAHHYQQTILEEPGSYTHANYYASVHTSYDTCVTRNLVAPEKDSGEFRYVILADLIVAGTVLGVFIQLAFVGGSQVP